MANVICQREARGVKRQASCSGNSLETYVLLNSTSQVVALVIALLTVSYQAVRAAIANPVESLRYE